MGDGEICNVNEMCAYCHEITVLYASNKALQEKVELRERQREQEKRKNERAREVMQNADAALRLLPKPREFVAMYLRLPPEITGEDAVFTFKEIAAIMGVCAQTARKYEYAAWRKVRRLWRTIKWESGQDTRGGG
jgi:hypothetical protein